MIEKTTEEFMEEFSRLTEGRVLRDRVRGALVGLAVGDAMGMPFEFLDRHRIVNRITDFQSGGPFNLPAGTWTDDTAMALCMADSLNELGRFDEKDIMDRFVSWYKNGTNSPTGFCFDIGNTVRESLDDYLRTGVVNQTAIPSTSFVSNGAIMRLAPIAMFALADNNLADYLSASTLITHKTKLHREVSWVFGLMLSTAMRGNEAGLDMPADKEAIITPLPNNNPDDLAKRMLLYDAEIPEQLTNAMPHHRLGYIINKEYLLHSESTIPSDGSATGTLGAALWAFYTTNTFKDGLLQAVNLGGDSDTVGAVYGQLAGAYYGYNSIPVEWRDNLYNEGHLRQVADKLFDHVLQSFMKLAV